MINQKIINKILRFVKNNIDKPKGKQLHFSIAFRRNKIICVGFNNGKKTHSLACDFPFHFIHSEVSLLAKLKKRKIELSKFKKMRLINVRYSKSKISFRNAAPCKHCRRLLANYPFKELWFSNGAALEKGYI